MEFLKTSQEAREPRVQMQPNFCRAWAQSLGSGCGGPDPPKNWMDPLIFYIAIGAGLVGVTDCPKLGIPFYFFLEKGSNTPDREVGPPNFENAVAPLPKSDLIIIIIIIIKRRLISRRNMPGTLQGRVTQINTRKRYNLL